jgi:hypothetical protein
MTSFEGFISGQDLWRMPLAMHRNRAFVGIDDPDDEHASRQVVRDFLVDCRPCIILAAYFNR